MKAKKGFKNIFFNIVSQFISLSLGIIIPKLFIVSFGSEVNGAISSIGNFFSCFALLEAGIGAVATQALYKTVVNNDHYESNRILSAAAKYYKKLGTVYIILVIALALVYPIVVASSLSKITLFCIIIFTGMGGAINFFLQYKYTIIINAEGRNYITTNINMFLNVLSSLAKVALLLLGYNVIAVQFAQFLITLLRIFILNVYMKKNFTWIDFDVDPNYAALAQRNAQLIHQISYLIFSNTDVLVLTLITQDLKLVSVYSVYTMIIGVLDGIIASVNNGLTFVFGQTYAEDKKEYRKIFDIYEVLYMILCFSCFLTTLYFIIPFLKLYTAGITDVNYLDAKLALLFVVMKLFVSIRSQCYTAIIISGNFKRTQNSAIIEAAINLISSIILVFKFGIYGCLLGTIAGLLYRNLYCIIFANKIVLERSPLITLRRWGLNAIIFIIFYFVKDLIVLPVDSYIMQIVSAGCMCVTLIIIELIINYSVDRQVFIDTIEAAKSVRKGWNR